jgi:predicted NAD/FAD-dependent oxidoreductase
MPRPTGPREHYEQDQEFVIATLLQEYFQVTGQKPQTPAIAKAHRWRYSIPVSASDAYCCFNSDLTLIACGDWAGGSRVEGAFLSGCAAAGRILNTLERPQPKQTQGFLF